MHHPCITHAWYPCFFQHGLLWQHASMQHPCINLVPMHQPCLIFLVRELISLPLCKNLHFYPDFLCVDIEYFWCKLLTSHGFSQILVILFNNYFSSPPGGWMVVAQVCVCERGGTSPFGCSIKHSSWVQHHHCSVLQQHNRTLSASSSEWWYPGVPAHAQQIPSTVRVYLSFFDQVSWQAMLQLGPSAEAGA